MASEHGYREPARRRVALKWRGDPAAALERLYKEREWKLNVGAALVACLMVLAGGFFVERLTELIAFAIGAVALGPLARLIRYALATHERRIVRVEGTLEPAPFGGHTIRSGDRHFRLVAPSLPEGTRVPRPVVAQVHPGFDAAIAWAPLPMRAPRTA